LGATGMLGNAVMQVLSSTNFEMDVHGTLRSSRGLHLFPAQMRTRLIPNIDVTRDDDVIAVLVEVRPDVVINCTGIVKQLNESKEPLVVLPLNALFPHRLSRLCQLARARLIHISTDCVFSGDKGGYREDDQPDATDLYGISKRLGEVAGDHAVTLRTSIIGHELQGTHSLLDWFLNQKGKVSGYTEAYFSGLPTNELARVIAEHVIPNEKLNGLYHVSADRISKHDLLKIVADVYDHHIEIEPSGSLQIDRSLNSDRFRQASGYVPPVWRDLIKFLHCFRNGGEGVAYSNAVPSSGRRV
jgi:dTDP-4-dehydrorhamnose reductase